MPDPATPEAPRSIGDRPWLCPERRCTPLLNLRDGEYADIAFPPYRRGQAMSDESAVTAK